MSFKENHSGGKVQKGEAHMMKRKRGLRNLRVEECHEPEKAEADGSASYKGNQEALNRDSSTAAGTLIGAK